MKRIAVLIAVVVAPAMAAEPSPYLGAWRITEAHAAPWAVPGSPDGNPESRRLVGKVVVYAPGRIVGPLPLACSAPHYAMHDAPLDELFQGTLTAPEAQAAALGFHGPLVPTLETGCAGWIDFHFADASTAMFGLNDMVYTLRRQ